LRNEHHTSRWGGEGAHPTPSTISFDEKAVVHENRSHTLNDLELATAAINMREATSNYRVIDLIGSDSETEEEGNDYKNMSDNENVDRSEDGSGNDNFKDDNEE
jgi:hypothetical protein